MGAAPEGYEVSTKIGNQDRQRGWDVAQLLRHLAELNDQGFGGWPVVMEGFDDDAECGGAEPEPDEGVCGNRVYLRRTQR